jgi:hypothetical protein
MIISGLAQLTCPQATSPITTGTSTITVSATALSTAGFLLFLLIMDWKADLLAGANANGDSRNHGSCHDGRYNHIDDHGGSSHNNRNVNRPYLQDSIYLKLNFFSTSVSTFIQLTTITVTTTSPVPGKKRAVPTTVPLEARDVNIAGNIPSTFSSTLPEL